ncbi:MAG: DUF4277 domain-containing protein [Cyanobacteria bacterium P01_D01_bin.6]
MSTGVAAKALILHGFSFVSAPLYLVERFFVGKATGAPPEDSDYRRASA